MTSCCDKSSDPVLSKLIQGRPHCDEDCVSPRRHPISIEWRNKAPKLQTGAAQEVADDQGEFPPRLMCVCDTAK